VNCLLELDQAKLLTVLLCSDLGKATDREGKLSCIRERGGDAGSRCTATPKQFIFVGHIYFRWLGVHVIDHGVALTAAQCLRLWVHGLVACAAARTGSAG
jgi:hypothetical protein